MRRRAISARYMALSWLADGVLSQVHLARFKRLEHPYVVSAQRVNAEHGGAVPVQVLFSRQEAGNPSQPNRFDVVVVEQRQSWNGLLVVALG